MQHMIAGHHCGFTLIFQFPIYLEPGDRSLPDILVTVSLVSKYIGELEK